MCRSGPLLSVIVPVYNTEQYLNKCIESIRAQTYHNLEIILVDDGSTDRSYEICQKHQAQDPRIKLIHKENEGITKTRKAGLNIATGAYVGWVDSDDWVDPDYFGNMVEAAVSDGVDVVCVQSAFMEYSNHTAKAKAICPSGVYAGQELLKCAVALGKNISGPKEILRILWTMIFRREILTGIFPLVDDGIVVGEDTVVVYGAISRSARVKLLDRGGYHHRVWNNSVTHRQRTAEEWMMNLRLRWSSCRDIMSEENWKIYEPLFWQGVKRYYLLKDLSFWDELFGGKTICLWPFQGGAKYTDRIALYGAGKLGKAIYRSLMDRNIEITAWVDANWQRYERKGLPVEARETLQVKTFDKIVVAVLDRNIAAQITEYLESQSIPKEKILYLTDEFLDDVEFMKQCLQGDAGKDG